MDKKGFAMIRAEFETKVGKTWTTSEMEAEFEITSFGGGFAFGNRRDNGEKMSLDFTRLAPGTERLYFNM